MTDEIKKYIPLIRKHLFSDYQGMFRAAGGSHKHPFITPGSASYADVLWDWDSWLSNIALRQIIVEKGSKEELATAREHERGCVLNFLDWTSYDGWCPICVERGADVNKLRPRDIYAENMHKPCLAQHAAFLVKQDGDAQWLREKMFYLQSFINAYRNHHRHECGVYFWQNDHAIGVDNDPSTFGRPPRSSGSIYLNALMYREILALVYLLEQLNQKEIADQYRKDAENLKAAVQEHCWDERDGCFYSVDLNLLPVEHTEASWHHGQTRDWPCLIQRIGSWSGFLALWAELATPEQARRIVQEHYRNERTFNAPFGVRTLSRMEKMYNVRASGNTSSWLGPIWGISNYLTFRGLVKYGFADDARGLAGKTVRLFGRDLERSGALHEYYLPDSGEPVLNPGFQNWNYLVLNMINYLEGKDAVAEF